MNNSFYNTINLADEKLKVANEKALSQEELVKEVFNSNLNIKYSPSTMMQYCRIAFDRDCPITSWRRAMTNLSSAKHNYFLVKTDEMTDGLFGYPEHLWKKNTLNNLSQSKLF